MAATCDAVYIGSAHLNNTLNLYITIREEHCYLFQSTIGNMLLTVTYMLIICCKNTFPASLDAMARSGIHVNPAMSIPARSKTV